eukprot:jgi/Hompol1/843/HPOL_005441-RA
MSTQVVDQTHVMSNNNETLVMDAVDYIDPELQNFVLTDLNANVLRVIADGLGPNHRLMVNLVCRRRAKEAPARNIIFVIATSSPYTYLCQEAMEALVGKDSKLPKTLYVKIHREQVIQACISPPDSHFAQVNVLGMDFLKSNNVYPRLDFNELSFTLE